MDYWLRSLAATTFAGCHHTCRVTTGETRQQAEKGKICATACCSTSGQCYLPSRSAGAPTRWIVHVSITHPGIDSPFPYFRGKALVERALAETGVSYAIVRPTILFGGRDVLINNIAWLLRHLPVFAVGGRGDYRLRPIHVDDLARLCVELAGDDRDTVVDAVGPERPTFDELVKSIRVAVGSRALVVHLPGSTLPVLSGLLGFALRDVLLTQDEYRAMACGLADTRGSATGSTSLSGWLEAHGPTLGLHYANELDRHFREAGVHPHKLG